MGLGAGSECPAGSAWASSPPEGSSETSPDREPGPSLTDGFPNERAGRRLKRGRERPWREVGHRTAESQLLPQNKSGVHETPS